jgi:hypothetical protein
MATKQEEVDNPKSTLNRAHDHEPIFILRGSDPTAVNAINAWLGAMSTIEYLHKMGLTTASIPSEKFEGAARLRDLMVAWQSAHADLVKLPD